MKNLQWTVLIVLVFAGIVFGHSQNYLSDNEAIAVSVSAIIIIPALIYSSMTKKKKNSGV